MTARGNGSDDYVEGRMLIGGELIESEGGGWLRSFNPANEEEIGRVPNASARDVERAVTAAEQAQPAWAALDAFQRGRQLRELATALRKQAEPLLRLEVRDTGNTITKMRGDVEHAAKAIEYFAGIGGEIKGETIPASSTHLHVTLREPYGVVGRIVPFNHPIKFACHALAAPLMAGNTVIVKPPEQSPLSATVLARLCAELLPPGVVNIVTGEGMPAGDAIARHPRIKRIAFTGSVPTGRAILRAAAEVGVKHITLELGGKNPLIAFPDVNSDTVAAAAVAGMNFAWQGQSCGSTSRLLLHESVYDEVLAKILERVSALKLGDPLDTGSQMGPINSRRQLERVITMVERGKTDGARLMIGGVKPKSSPFERGFWFCPTVFGEVDANMSIAQEEIFGPVLSVLRWQTEQEAYNIANATEYGLTASIWTHDLNVALRAARAVRSGYIWVNDVATHFYGTPFGGFRNSGLGREEGLGELLSYTETKSVHLKLR